MSESIEQRLVKHTEQLLEKEPNKTERKNAGKLWRTYLSEVEDLELSSEMLRIVGGQAQADNRAKPIALYRDNNDLLLAQDPEFFERTENSEYEAKRQSLIESCQYHGRERKDISVEVVLSLATTLLRESALPLPDDIEDDENGELEQYVESIVRSLERDRCGKSHLHSVF